jgi:hypothetical protein
VRKLIEDAVAGLPGIRVEIRRLLLARALRPLPGHEKLVDSLLRNARQVMGGPSPPMARRSIPMPACMARPASVVLFGAGPRTSWNPMPSRPMRTWRWMISKATRWSR